MTKVLRALIVAPEHDYATEGSHRIAEIIMNILPEYDIEGILLQKKDAIRGKFETIVKEKRPTLIVYLGHGDDDVLYGQIPPGDRTPMIEDTKNPDILKGTVTVAIACHSLNRLGSIAVFKGGCDIYIGSDSYYFLPGNDEEHSYMDDFARCILALVIALVNGDSAKEALDQYRQLCEEYEAEYDKIGTPIALTARNWMMANRLSMGIRGEAAGGLVFGIYNKE